MILPIPLDTPILVVEDTPEDQEALSYVIRSLGMTNPVAMVENGDDALDYLLGNGAFGDRSRFPVPGIVFLDINLPQRNGIETLRGIREIEAYAELPVVMLTVSDADQDVLASFELDALFYMEKPVRPENLRELFELPE